MRFYTWLGVIFVTIATVLVVAFLPEYAAQRVDAGTLNRISTYTQEQTETMNQGIKVIDRIRILGQGLESGNQTCVVNKAAGEISNAVDKELFTQIRQQTGELVKQNLIPDIMDDNTQWKYEFIQLNAYTNNNYLGKVLYVWEVQATIKKYNTVHMILDASSYKIYSITFDTDSNEKDDELQLIFDEFRIKKESRTSHYMEQWVKKYLAYLNIEEDVSIQTYDNSDYNNEWELEQLVGVAQFGSGDDGIRIEIDWIMDFENQNFVYAVMGSEESDFYNGIIDTQKAQ
ncbi:unknown [Clostridium sp. CAG:590]|nr:unknown [Clostridium sp. CAG:590]